jgi:hypothetical protein
MVLCDTLLAIILNMAGLLFAMSRILETIVISSTYFMQKANKQTSICHVCRIYYIGTKVLEKREISRMQKIGIGQERDVAWPKFEIKDLRWGKISKDDDRLGSTLYGDFNTSDSAYVYQPPELST